MPKSQKDQTLQILKKIEKRLDSIEKNQQRVLSEEEEVIKEEKEEITEQKQEISELKNLEELEKKIDQEVKKSPLTNISFRDFYKSIIGAFIGVIGHFSFFYGVELAHDITITRAIVLYLVSFMIGILFVYFAGFRKVQDLNISKFVPVRVLVIYMTSIAVIIIVLYLFGFISTHSTIEEIFKNVSTISILAVLGASTADLIGGKNE